MIWVVLYLAIGGVNTLVAAFRGHWDHYEETSDVLVEAVFYALLWPVQVAFIVWTLIAHPVLTLTSPAYRQHQRDVDRWRKDLREEA